MWKSLSITKKVWLSISILVVGYFGTMAFGFILGRQTEAKLYIIADKFFPATKQGQFALTAFREQVKGYYDAVMVGDESILEQADLKSEEVQAALNSVIKLKEGEPKTVLKIMEIQKRLKNYSKMTLQVYKILVAQESYVDVEEILNKHDQEFLKKTVYLAAEEKALKAELTELAGSLSSDLRKELAYIGNITRNQRYLNMIVFFVVVATALSLIALIIYRSISQPLEKTYMLENAVKQSIDGVAVTDLEGNFQFINHSWAAMHGYKIEELVDKGYPELYVDEQHEKFVNAFVKKVFKNGSHTGESIHQKKDGDTFPILLSVSLLKDQAGTPISMVVIGKDITEQKKNERILEETRQQLIEKAHQAGMADIATGTLHNVGNILNSVKTSAQMIREMSMGGHLLSGFSRANDLLRKNIDTLEDFISKDPKGLKLMQYYLKLEEGVVSEQERLRKHVERLNDKVDAIVDVITAQQAYAGTTALTEALSLSEIVEDALMMQSASLQKHNIRVSKEFNDVPNIQVQKVKLVHILINLIQNAKDAMLETDPKDRRMVFSINKNEKAAFIKISDTGSGILPENLEKIFSHGFTTKHSGHGFGLHSCANYMTEMGGRMWAESDGLGKGSMFVLRFQLSGSG